MKFMAAFLTLGFVVAGPVLAEVVSTDLGQLSLLAQQPTVCTDDLCPQVNPSGLDQSVHTAGLIDKANPFFQQMGANDRTCNTCHLVDQGWSISPPDIRKLFRDTDG